jgi:hypothetical protein
MFIGSDARLILLPYTSYRHVASGRQSYISNTLPYMAPYTAYMLAPALMHVIHFYINATLPYLGWGASHPLWLHCGIHITDIHPLLFAHDDGMDGLLQFVTVMMISRVQ